MAHLIMFVGTDRSCSGVLTASDAETMMICSRELTAPRGRVQCRGVVPRLLRAWFEEALAVAVAGEEGERMQVLAKLVPVVAGMAGVAT